VFFIKACNQEHDGMLKTWKDSADVDVRQIDGEIGPELENK
jgi:hypothetical protein